MTRPARVAEAPERLAHVGREGLAHACAGFVTPAAVQSVIDPARFRGDWSLDATAGPMAQIETPAP